MEPLASGAPDLAAAVERLADRLRSLSDVRLAGPGGPRASRADAAHALAQQLADAAALIEGGPSRMVPRLHDLAVGDQVAVTGHDLVAAAAAQQQAPRVRVDLAGVLERAVAACGTLAEVL